MRVLKSDLHRVIALAHAFCLEFPNQDNVDFMIKFESTMSRAEKDNLMVLVNEAQSSAKYLGKRGKKIVND